MRIRLFAIASATLLASALTTGVAEASHSWNGYHWARTADSFSLTLADNVDAKWDASLEGASSDWTRSTVLDTSIVAGANQPRTCKATAGRVEVCNSKYGRTGWLGIASISVTSGTHITQGTVKLNDTYFDTAQYDTPAWRNMVTCQEVGHTFGLDHQDEGFDNTNLNTCMDYTNNPSTNEHPNAHDYEELEAIYSHLDSTSTVGSAASSNSPQVGNAQSSWGRQVAGSRSARHSTFVRNFEGGDLVVTFVTWA